ncbi:hypothetical protein MLD38_036598 [Melastoma candidum]|uniref:Uncharacterized protein n=1 Tax=Melastoma candidum TaxID=119954 RepID=A0ACB9LL54_9MYRT|nr:hypothetical protein MLD38_036598 [Melastoma candidum]
MATQLRHPSQEGKPSLLRKTITATGDSLRCGYGWGFCRESEFCLGVQFKDPQLLLSLQLWHLLNLVTLRLLLLRLSIVRWILILQRGVHSGLVIEAASLVDTTCSKKGYHSLCISALSSALRSSSVDVKGLVETTLEEAHTKSNEIFNYFIELLPWEGNPALPSLKL